MFASRLAGPLTAGFFVKQPKASCVEGDLEALLVRMRQRRYPETIPVLASYWLRTVHASGYGRRHWKKLNRLLKRALGEHPRMPPPVRPSWTFRPGSSRAVFSPAASHRDARLHDRNAFLPP